MARYFIALLLSLCLPFAASAEISGKAKRTILIGNINKSLADFAEDSGIKISYDDIVYYDEPMFGAYLSFVKPKITVAYGATYEFSARNVALKDDGEGQMRLSIPSHMTMTQTRGQQVNEFAVSFDGLPSLLFRANDSLMLNHYQIASPDNVTMRFKHTASGTRAEVAFDGVTLRSNQWKAINPLKPSDITAFIDKIGAAFLYPCESSIEISFHKNSHRKKRNTKKLPRGRLNHIHLQNTSTIAKSPWIAPSLFCYRLFLYFRN